MENKGRIKISELDMSTEVAKRIALCLKKHEPEIFKDLMVAINAVNIKYNITGQESNPEPMEVKGRFPSNTKKGNGISYVCVYEQDNTTAMNCKHCGKSKWLH